MVLILAIVLIFGALFYLAMKAEKKQPKKRSIKFH